MIRQRFAPLVAAFLTSVAPAFGDEFRPTPKPDTTIQTPQPPTTPNIESLGDADKFCPAETPEEKQQREKPPVPMC